MLPRRPAALAIIPFLTACAAQPARFEGPFRVRSQHPAQLTVGVLPAQDVGTPAGVVRARWTNAYSSLFLAGNGNGNTFAMDGEFLRSALGARWGISDRFELDVEIAVASTTGGFLDEFIVDWHDFFGFPNHGRDTAPKDEFVVRAERAGTIGFEVEERSLALLDMPIRAAWTLREPDPELPLAVAARCGVELPTGDDRRGYGNGGYDFSLGLQAEYLGEWAGLTAHVGHTFVETPDQAESAGLEFADVTTFGVGIEIPLLDAWHAIVQFDAETSTLRRLDFPRVADEQLGLWIGARGRLAERTFLEVAVGEDLNEFIAPDFTVWFSLLQGFGTPHGG